MKTINTVKALFLVTLGLLFLMAGSTTNSRAEITALSDQTRKTIRYVDRGDDMVKATPSSEFGLNETSFYIWNTFFSNEPFSLKGRTFFNIASLMLLPTSEQDKTGVCWFDASGKRTGMDSCFVGNSLSSPCGNQSGAVCSIDASGICRGSGDYAMYLVLKPEDDYQCPDTFSKKTNPPANPSSNKIPVSAELSLQSGIQPGANGKNRIPLSYEDPAYTVQKLDKNPAIYLDVTFADGSTMGPHDYKKKFAGNVVFDDTSGDPNDIIAINWWHLDADNPQMGKYAAQLTSTGNGIGTAYLKVSFRNAPNVSASVKVEVVSGATQTSSGSSTVIEDQFWNAIKDSTDVDDFKSYLKEFPNGKYAAIAQLKVNASSGGTNLPPTNRPPSRQTDIQFLNSWADDIKTDLPEMVGDFQLTDAWSSCPSGCQRSGDYSNYLWLYFKAQNEQRTAPIADLERTLKPLLLQVYCKSEAIQRNIPMGVYFGNRAQDRMLNFYVQPEDCSATPPQGKIVFVTSAKYTGNLGGVSGANNICRVHAKNAGLGGTFKAWISDRNSSPIKTFTHSNIPYILTDGTQIAANWQGLIDESLDVKIDVDENRRKVLNNPGIWTGTKENGSMENARRGSPNCSDWTDASGGVQGWHGCTSTNASGWSTCGTNWCNQTYALYCFQQ